MINLLENHFKLDLLLLLCCQNKRIKRSEMANMFECFCTKNIIFYHIEIIFFTGYQSQYKNQSRCLIRMAQSMNTKNETIEINTLAEEFFFMSQISLDFVFLKYKYFFFFTRNLL